MRILVTGGAGFIGYHASKALLSRGHSVFAIDDLNTYYDPRWKAARLSLLEKKANWRFTKTDIGDASALGDALKGQSFDAILHLAAQAGVRYSLENPGAYTRSNLVGHQNILEWARRAGPVPFLVYASSSSVYGNDTPAPFREDARADKPVSYYGATKRACELMSYSYASLFGLRQIGLRFFTVYGRFGRPDMAYWSFTDAILRGDPISVFGEGKLRRDFTHVDDIVSGIVAALERPAPFVEGDPPHRVYNLGNHRPVMLLDFIRTIEKHAGRAAVIQYKEGPAGDVQETYADITAAGRDLGFSPTISLDIGLADFIQWFRETV